MKVLVFKGENYTEIASADSVKVIFEDGEIDGDICQRHYTLNDEGIVFDSIINDETDYSLTMWYDEFLDRANDDDDSYIFNGPSAYAMPFENDNEQFYNCYLISFVDKIKTAKLLRELVDITVAEAVKHLNSLPVIIGYQISKQAAEELSQKFIDINCETEIK